MTAPATTEPAPERSPVVVITFALAFVSLVAYVPQTIRPSLVGRSAALLFAVAAGLPLLVQLVRAGDRTARAGGLFGAAALASALLAATPLAWAGFFFAMTGAVFVVGVLSCWALGRELPDEALPALRTAVLAGAAVNALVAVVQMRTSLESFDISLYDERATGLLGNPVFLGALTASAVALLTEPFRRRPVLLAPVAVLLATATELSGARNALAVLVLVTAWGAVRCGWARGALLAAAIVAGVLLGSAMQPSRSTSAVGRLENPAGGLHDRMENWGDGLSGLRHRPVLGYGPGRGDAAGTPHRSLTLATSVGADRLYRDGHNIFMEYAVTTGVIGGGLFVAWVGLVAWPLRRPRHPDLAVAAGVLFTSHLLEPLHLTLTPLMFLLAAAAAARPDDAACVASRPNRIGHLMLGAAAVVVSAVLLVGDFTHRSASLDFDLAGARRASTLQAPWAAPLSLEARIHLFRARTLKDRAETRAALTAARRAVDREPDDPIRWVALASILEELDRHQEALRAYAEALERNPWSGQALSGLAEVRAALGDVDAAGACRAATRLQTRNESALRRSRSHCLGQA